MTTDAKENAARLAARRENLRQRLATKFDPPQVERLVEFLLKPTEATEGLAADELDRMLLGEADLLIEGKEANADWLFGIWGLA
jgi:hypothetical protein